jgi:hypothetical protein
MSAAVALERERAREPAVPSRAEFRELLERVLEDVDSDEKIGTLMRAAGLRVRFHYPDLDLTVNVAPSEENGHHLRWTFADNADWSPKLELTMDSDVANRYLQGRESLAVGIARGRVQTRGESRAALLYLPALRLVCEPYRRVLLADYQHLAIA